MSAGRRRLVVLRALKLGDFLTGIPALRALAQAFPDHERILAAPLRFEELIEQTGMHRVAPTPSLVKLSPDLAGADVAVDLHGRGPESQRILMDLAPRRLISFRCTSVPTTAGSPPWRPDEHEVHRWCRLLRESGIPADPADIRLHRPFARPTSDREGRLVQYLEEGAPSEHSAGAAKQRATIVHPGAASAARRWPPERFAAVARHEAATGRKVVVTGSREERELALEVATGAGLSPSAVLAGRTSLVELAELVAGAGRVVCGDTGIAHMATATGTPSVVLFGPVPPAEWGPPPCSRHVCIWTGRRGDPHAAVPDAGLLEIGVETVLSALNGLTEAEEIPLS